MYRMSYSKIPLALKVEINYNLINIIINNFNAQPPYLQKLVPYTVNYRNKVGPIGFQFKYEKIVDGKKKTFVSHVNPLTLGKTT